MRALAFYMFPKFDGAVGVKIQDRRKGSSRPRSLARGTREAG